MPPELDLGDVVFRPAPPGEAVETTAPASSRNPPMRFPVHVDGYSDAEVLAAAQAYAAARTGYRPAMLVDATVVVVGGLPSVLVRYATPTGDSDEMTPLEGY